MSDPTEPGWYPHPTKRGKFAYFDGSTWDKDLRDEIPVPRRPVQANGTDGAPRRPGSSVEPPTSPHAYLWGGIVLSAVAGLLSYFSSQADSDGPAAWLLLAALFCGAVGSILTVIGGAGVGVLIALDFREHKR